MKRYSTSPLIREMQIKITRTHQLTSARIAILKKTGSKCWQRCRGKGTCASLVSIKLAQPQAKKTRWKLLKKLKIELPYEAAIPRLGIYPKELQAGSQTESYTPTFIPTLFTIAKTWKQRKCPLTNEQKNKTWYTRTMQRSALRARNPVICNNTDESKRHYAKWNKPVTRFQTFHDSIKRGNLEEPDT